MDGEEYFSLNPGVFSEKTQWTYQNLKSLCKELGLGGSGKRCELEAKLQRWHLSRTEGENLVPSAENEENLPMNVLGSNFNILKIVPPTEREQKGNRNKRKQPLIPSIEIDNKENYCCPSPTQFKFPVTPSKSILKQDSRSENCPVSASKINGIKFSPFNKVRIIPHRIFHFEAFDEELSDCENNEENYSDEIDDDESSDSDSMEY
jgi:hypothetical protein